MKLILLALLACSALAAPQKPRTNETKLLNGPVEWYFFGQGGNNLDVYLSTMVGTPYQYIDVMISMQGTDDLRVGSGSNGDGDFKENDSSTWKDDGTATEDNGVIYGTKCEDVFKVGFAEFKNKLPFSIQYPPYTYTNYIGLGPVKSDFSFLKTILTGQNDQTITIAFGTYPTDGIVTIGGIDKTRCYKDWRIMKEVTWQSQYDKDSPSRWGVAIDKLSVGKFAASSPGYATFTVNDELTLWPKKVYASIIKELGSNDGLTVPCDTNVNINFQIEDITLTLTPDMYLDREMEKVSGTCMLSGTTVDDSDEYRFPQAFFSQHCLSINHHTQQIGFATRKTSQQ